MPHRRRFLTTLAAAPLAPQLTFAQQAKTPPPPADPTLDVFQAAFKGDTARATELAKLNPALARLRAPDGRTPLHFAIEGGRPEAIFFWTSLGADLSAGPESPLLAAVDYPDHAAASAMAQGLLINNSDPNARRKDGRTALQLAVARGYGDIAELLVHRGATGPEAAGIQTDLVHFDQRRRYDVDGGPWRQGDIEGLPQDFINEFVSKSHGDGARVHRMLKMAPALIWGTATWDETAIEAAAHMGLAGLARQLADAGAAVSTCTATLLGIRERVMALVQADPLCVHERGAHDIPILAYTAFAEQRTAIADFLLTSGAAVGARALGGQTTLHLAARKGYVELAEVLLAHGAEVNATANSATPLAAAVAAKQEKMAMFLKSKGAKS